MSSFNFNESDKHLSRREFMFAYPSVIIGITILSLPSDVAQVTNFSDGWISILIAGILITFMAILAVKTASQFPDKPFLEYTSILVTKPIAMIIALLYSLTGILMSAYITRSVSYISQQYLFDRTPLPVIALGFILVVIYAVAGSRIGLFRLNILFLPIILFVYLFVGILNIPWYEATNYLPLFKTDFGGYFKGIIKTIPAFSGFAIGLFYVFLVKEKKHLTKKVVVGMSVPIIFYLFIFLTSIGIFGNTVTATLMHPTIELAKRVDVPGAIFERIDAFVFTIWIMAIFNTTVIIFDVAVLLLNSIFTKATKQMIAFILSPITLYIGMFPRTLTEVQQLMDFIGKINMSLSFLVIFGLYILSKLKGGQIRENT